MRELTSSPRINPGDSPSTTGRDGWLALRRPPDGEVSTPCHRKPCGGSDGRLAIADRSDARESTTPGRANPTPEAGGLRPRSPITLSDVAIVAAMVGAAVLIAVASVGVCVWVEARDRRQHTEAQQWRVLDEDLPEELSDTELSMVGFNGEVA